MNIEEIAQGLDTARITCKPIPAPTLDIKTAEKILKEGINLRILKGEKITGLILQEGNYFSFLTNQMNLFPGSKFLLKDCIAPKVSAHFVYYIDSPIKGDNSFEKIMEATSSVGMALTVSDSRFVKEGKNSIEEKMADNFFSSYYFLGIRRLDIREMRDRVVRIGLFFNKEKKIDMEILELVQGLSNLKNYRNLELKSSSILLSPSLFEPILLESNSDISLKVDYFGQTVFRVI